jgi:glutamate dehydrogenase (NAD(P)+)
VKVVAVVNQYGAAHASTSLDIPALQAHVKATGSVVDIPGADPLDPADLLELEVDLPVPAAIEGVLRAGNAKRVQAKIIAEGANGSTTGAADKRLSANEVLVVPDIVANAGGVIVSYFEWVQGKQSYWWTETEIDH